VDLVCNHMDARNLATLIRRGVARHRQFFSRFLECLEISEGA
jgi:hypothetical protein